MLLHRFYYFALSCHSALNLSTVAHARLRCDDNR